MSAVRVHVTSTDSGAIRTETFRGHNYTVVPVIALVETVLQGLNASAPEFAPADEFAKYPYAWDGRPVTLDHPRSNGQLCSANDPSILEAYQIGFLANSVRDGDKLKSEAWIDEDLVAGLGEDAVAMLDTIKAGEEFVEVSTGLFTDVVKTFGTFNSTNYNLAWQGVVPDHLAFLPNSIGACSVADGCGVPRLNAAGVTLSGGVTAAKPINLGVPQANSGAGDTPCGCKKEPVMATNSTETTDANGITGSQSGNSGSPRGQADASGEASQGNGTSSAAEAGDGSDGTAPGAAEGNVPAEPAGPSVTVETVTMEDGVQTKTTTTGTPEEVAEALAAQSEKAEILDRFVTNSVPANLTFENIREILRDAIRTQWPHDTSCYDCCYYSSYIVALNSDWVAFEHRENGVYTNVAVQYSIDESGGVTFTGEPVPVNLIVQIVPKPGPASVTANSEGGELSGANQQKEGQMADETTGGGGDATTTVTPTQTAGETRVNGAGEGNTAPAPRTLEQALADMPSEMSEMMQEALELRTNKRNELVQDIVANSNGVFTVEDLAGKKLPELTKLAALASARPDFSGRAMPIGRQEGLAANATAAQRDNQRSVPPAPRAFGKKDDEDGKSGKSGRNMSDMVSSDTGASVN